MRNLKYTSIHSISDQNDDVIIGHIVSKKMLLNTQKMSGKGN